MTRLMLCSIAALAIVSPERSSLPTTHRGAPRVDIRQANGRVPLRVEVNAGQADPRVRFLARGNGYTLYFADADVVLVAAGRAGDGSAATLRTTFPGADPRPHMRGLEPLPGKVRYVLGEDSRTWRHDVETYRAVAYQNLYPGVDMVYHGREQQWQYDFIVAPGADPRVITLAFEGVNGVDVDTRGDLVLQTRWGEVRHKRPSIFQDLGDVRREVPGHYVRRHGNQIGFEVAAYDCTRPLVIDPTISFSTYLGGSGYDSGTSVAVDQAGDIYLAGETGSVDFPTAAPFQPTNHGSFDVVVTKLSGDGSTLIYSTYIGGSFGELGRGIAVDGEGNAYVTGFTSSPDFPVLTPFQPTRQGPGDAFVLKLLPDGSLGYSSYLGGSSTDFGFAIGVDTSGTAIVTGATFSPDFPTVNPLDSSYGGNRDAFVAKVHASGSSLVYATFLGGAGADSAAGLAVHPDGDVYVTGFTTSSDFPIVDALQPSLGGVTDAYVARIAADGSILRYSTYLGGGGADTGIAIAVDRDGAAYVTGGTESLDFPVSAPLQPALAGVRDAFVTKVRADGGALLYSTYVGGQDVDIAYAITVSAANMASVTGITTSTDFPVASPTQMAPAGGSDSFVFTMNASGSALLFSTYLGGSGNDRGLGLASHGSNGLVVVGESTSRDFPVVNPMQATNAGGYEVVVTRIDP